MDTFKPRFVATVLVIVFTLGSAVTVYASGHTEQRADGRDAAAAVPELNDITIAALRGPTGVGIAPYLAVGETTTAHGRVTFEVVPDPGTMVARLSSGEAEVGMLPSNVVAQLYNRDVPVQIAAVTLWGLLYVVGSDDGISEWRDLEGRTIESIGRGATPDIIARHLLEESGLDAEENVSLSYRYPPAELAQLVIAGEVDLAILPEPFVTQVLSRRSDLSILLDVQQGWREIYGEAYPQTAIVVRSDRAAEAPEAIAEALGLIEAGWASVLDDPGGAGELVAASELGMPAPVVSASLPRFNARYASARQARAALEEYFAVLFAFDPRGVGGAIPDEGIYSSLPTPSSR